MQFYNKIGERRCWRWHSTKRCCNSRRTTRTACRCSICLQHTELAPQIPLFVIISYFSFMGEVSPNPPLTKICRRGERRRWRRQPTKRSSKTRRTTRTACRRTICLQQTELYCLYFASSGRKNMSLFRHRMKRLAMKHKDFLHQTPFFLCSRSLRHL